MSSFLAEIPTPFMGATIREVAVIELFVAAGAVVKKDQPMAVLETDKSAFVFEAPVSGIVRQIHAATGDVRAVGSPFLAIETDEPSARHLCKAPVGDVTAAASEGPAEKENPVSRTLEFSFGGPGPNQRYHIIEPDTLITADRAFGLEPGAGVTVRPPRSDGTVSCLTADAPFGFSVRVAEGVYRVTVTVGNSAKDAVTRISAETRRLMVEHVATKAGQVTTVAFNVDIRSPKLSDTPESAPGGNFVFLKPRELNVPQLNRTWDDKLSLQFGHVCPGVCTVTIAPVADPVRVFLAGDSTVADEAEEYGTGWGQMLPRFFTPEITVANHAASGQSLKSFITERRLAKLISQIRPNDYVFIQFGHGDQKRKTAVSYANSATYKAYLGVVVAEARQRGAIPILFTPMQRMTFGAGGRIVNTLGAYPEAVREVAAQANVPLIDLCALTTTLFEAIGPEKARLVLFDEEKDRTHLREYGAYETARCVVQGIRVAGLPLATAIASDVEPFDPVRPDNYEAWVARTGYISLPNVGADDRETPS